MTARVRRNVRKSYHPVAKGRTERAPKHPYAVSVAKPATMHGDAPRKRKSNGKTRNRPPGVLVHEGSESKAQSSM